MRVHRSYLVALDKIDAIEGNQLWIGKARIPVSKSYRGMLAELVARYGL
jgi:DNA-binding LytR/AlgR family response regulator